MRLEPRQKILIDQTGLARPTIDERYSSTNVIVKDEETAIVAGLREQDFADGTDGVPWFHTIPVLGWLFKDKSYRNDKTDLLAFVTPHILKQSQTLTDEEKIRYNEIDVQWDLPDKFYDDVKVDLAQ
jgi:type II secretory pathway component GspD/PulD (secretin)